MAVEFLPTLPGGKAIGAVQAAVEAGSCRTVIAMGGDGTVREVAAGLFGSTQRSRAAQQARGG